MQSKKKYIFNKYRLSPLTLKKEKIGSTKYSPAASKEWKNSIYFYNQNFIKNLFIYDINIYTLLKSYFNAYFENKFLVNINKENKRLQTKLL